MLLRTKQIIWLIICRKILFSFVRIKNSLFQANGFSSEVLLVRHLSYIREQCFGACNLVGNFASVTFFSIKIAVDMHGNTVVHIRVHLACRIIRGFSKFKIFKLTDSSLFFVNFSFSQVELLMFILISSYQFPFLNIYEYLNIYLGIMLLKH